jgi:hypothetical protein
VAGVGPVPLAPGMRTSAGRGRRAMVGAAVQAVFASPRLWLLGIVAFAVRGGSLLLTLPILTIPSPVLLSILFRDDLSTSGVAPGVQATALVLAVVTALAVLVAIIVSAWCDLLAFESVVRDDASIDLRLGRRPRRFASLERRSLLLWLAAIQAAALLPVLVIVMAIVGSLQATVTGQVQRPTDLDTPLLLRVLRDLGGLVLALVAAIALLEVVVSLAERRLLVARAGLLPRGAGERTETRLAISGALRLLRHPVRELGVALVSWTAALTAVLIGVGSVTLAWSATRPGLQALALSGDPARLTSAPVALALLCAVWLAALCLCGLVTAFRTALWTMDTLR